MRRKLDVYQKLPTMCIPSSDLYSLTTLTLAFCSASVLWEKRYYRPVHVLLFEVVSISQLLGFTADYLERSAPFL